jgi:hypothetical protein
VATPYLTRAQYATRTGTPEADAPSEYELRLASDAVDAMGPYIGRRYSDTQERAFPRSITLPGDTEGAVPERVLDAVVELARSEQSGEDDTPITSHSVLDESVTYAVPKTPKSVRRVGALLSPYWLKVGMRA